MIYALLSFSLLATLTHAQTQAPQLTLTQKMAADQALVQKKLRAWANKEISITDPCEIDWLNRTSQYIEKNLEHEKKLAAIENEIRTLDQAQFLKLNSSLERFLDNNVTFEVNAVAGQQKNPNIKVKDLMEHFRFYNQNMAECVPEKRQLMKRVFNSPELAKYAATHDQLMTALQLRNSSTGSLDVRTPRFEFTAQTTSELSYCEIELSLNWIDQETILASAPALKRTQVSNTLRYTLLTPQEISTEFRRQIHAKHTQQVRSKHNIPARLTLLEERLSGMDSVCYEDNKRLSTLLILIKNQIAYSHQRKEMKALAEGYPLVHDALYEDQYLSFGEEAKLYSQLSSFYLKIFLPIVGNTYQASGNPKCTLKFTATPEFEVKGELKNCDDLAFMKEGFLQKPSFSMGDQSLSYDGQGRRCAIYFSNLEKAPAQTYSACKMPEWVLVKPKASVTTPARAK